VTEDGAAAIGKLCVHPRLQGHGIGARLLRAAESALAEERGAKKFRLHTGHRSEGNLRLYRRVGYETVGTSQGDDGVPMIVLEKPVEAYVATA
jgi:ribosomal protein S18 acetylase RimI-like enzyme